MSKLTHLDEAGHAHMVDVSGKSDTDRMATATAIVQLTQAAMDPAGGEFEKGRCAGCRPHSGDYGRKENL